MLAGYKRRAENSENNETQKLKPDKQYARSLSQEPDDSQTQPGVSSALETPRAQQGLICVWKILTRAQDWKKNHVGAEAVAPLSLQSKVPRVTLSLSQAFNVGVLKCVHEEDISRSSLRQGARHWQQSKWVDEHTNRD